MTPATDVSDELTGTRIKRILLTRQYRQIFFPSLIAAVAVSLSECVDSIIVSNLLDERALSIVNVCTPLMTMMAAVYLLFAVGGLICYTERRGRSDAAGAASIFTISLAMSLVISIFLVACGLLFTRAIGNLLCPGLILGEELLTYIRILSLSSPVVIVVSLVLYFLTAAGNPRLSMALNVFANVLNLLLDYVFLRLNFRSIGEPFDLSSFGEEDTIENYQLLTALVQDYTYNYTIGMNNLRVSFRLGDEDKRA